MFVVCFDERISLLEKAGDLHPHIEILDRMQEYFPDSKYPLNASILYSLNERSVLLAIELYIKCGAEEKGAALAEKFLDETLKSVMFFTKPYHGGYLSYADAQNCLTYYSYGIELLNMVDKDKADAYYKKIESLIQ